MALVGLEPTIFCLRGRRDYHLLYNAVGGRLLNIGPRRSTRAPNISSALRFGCLPCWPWASHGLAGLSLAPWASATFSHWHILSSRYA